MFRVIVKEDDLSWTDQAGVQKILAWMATIIAGHTTGIAPASGTEARTTLKENEDPLGCDIDALLQDLEAHPEADLADYRRRAHALKDRVLALLLDQLEAGKLGPRCTEVVSTLVASTRKA
ncbi:hypothetical protein [Actinopolymorpha singaporensis]|uniref:hypothetical protein n=1 Tax=Actinopolymorpha singaporensis TaxID=117157 RepID=UPI0012FD0BBF|nr:hypothetical protein [Actinopolymorpha singaporensis]